jgi:low temperature requirement protein LtrA
MKSYRVWWHKPALHQPGDEAGRVTWLELFYDLVFVVVIARLAHHLAAHPDLGGVQGFVLLFVPVWWIWTSATVYNERFETYDLSFRLFLLLQILTVGVLAANAEEGLGRTATGFVLAYVLARTLIVSLWLRAGYHNPVVRPVTNVFAVGFGVGLGLWLLSLVVPPALAVPLRALGLLTELLTPVLTFGTQSRVFTATARKLPERYGLFVIIVLGESLVGVINGLGEAGIPDLGMLLRFLAGMLVGFLLWWVYFDYIGRREPRSGAGRAWSLAAWSYLHLPLLMGLAAIGAMLQGVVGGSAAPAVGWILAGAFTLVYVSMAALEGVLERENPPLVATRPVVLFRLGTAAAALLLPLLGLSALGVVLGLVGLQLLHALVGVRAWFASDNAGRSDVH